MSLDKLGYAAPLWQKRANGAKVEKQQPIDRHLGRFDGRKARFENFSSGDPKMDSEDDPQTLGFGHAALHTWQKRTLEAEVEKQQPDDMHMVSFGRRKDKLGDFGPSDPKMDLQDDLQTVDTLLKSTTEVMRTNPEGKNEMNEEKGNTVGKEESKHMHMHHFGMKNNTIDCGKTCSPRRDMENVQMKTCKDDANGDVESKEQLNDPKQVDNDDERE